MSNLYISFAGDEPSAAALRIVGETLERLHNQWCERAQTFAGAAHPVPVRLTDESGRVFLVNPAAIACAWEQENA